MRFMKSSWKYISVIVTVALAISCTVQTDPTPTFQKSDAAFTATSDVSAVAVAASDSLDNAISFSWDDPKFSVGLEKSKFVVVFGVTGNNFASFQTKSFTGVKTGAWLGKELNGAALKLGGAIGQPISLDAKVVASQINNNEFRESAVITVSVTPYGDLSVTPSATDVVTSAVNASLTALTLNWTEAFVGYSGIKKYQLQYAKGGTNFGSPITVNMSSLTTSFTQAALNKLSIAVGVPAGTTGDVDFRIKATNELGTEMYSNTATVSVTTYVAYNSIGIIGDATAGSWGTDTDMYRPDVNGAPTQWTITVYLIGGKSVKFRADDDWTNNWGDTAFPSGTGTSNGPNIPVANSGYYKVDLNVGTGAYSFTAVASPTYTNISVIGGFNGWGADVDLTADVSGHVWTGTLTLAANTTLKLRANHDWTTAWGGVTLPSGFASTSGGDMAVNSGDYFIYFNDVSGEIHFGYKDSATPFNSIGVVGAFNGWGASADATLIKDPTNSYKWSGTVGFADGGDVKFRADSQWTNNWGTASFPSGVGTPGGSNITVPSGGSYVVTFNAATGEYTFTKN